MHSITNLKKHAGPLFKKEITAIDLVIKNKKSRALLEDKISTKINVISNLLKKVNNIVIVEQWLIIFRS